MTDNGDEWNGFSAWEDIAEIEGTGDGAEMGDEEREILEMEMREQEEANHRAARDDELASSDAADDEDSYHDSGAVIGEGEVSGLRLVCLQI